jgi:hypothetical protein
MVESSECDHATIWMTSGRTTWPCESLAQGLTEARGWHSEQHVAFVYGNPYICRFVSTVFGELPKLVRVAGDVVPSMVGDAVPSDSGRRSPQLFLVTLSQFWVSRSPVVLGDSIPSRFGRCSPQSLWSGLFGTYHLSFGVLLWFPDMTGCCARLGTMRVQLLLYWLYCHYLLRSLVGGSGSVVGSWGYFGLLLLR